MRAGQARGSREGGYYPPGFPRIPGSAAAGEARSHCFGRKGGGRDSLKDGEVYFYFRSGNSSVLSVERSVFGGLLGGD